VQVGLAQPQHHRRQREQLVLVAHIAQVRQRDQVAARGRARQAGAFGHLGDGQAAAFLVEGFDHLQAFFQPGHQIALGKNVTIVHKIPILCEYRTNVRIANIACTCHLVSRRANSYHQHTYT
jgi:hypothetical protein